MNTPPTHSSQIDLGFLDQLTLMQLQAQIGRYHGEEKYFMSIAVVEEIFESIAASAPPITCYKGCSACCYQPVATSLIEGRILITEMKNINVTKEMVEASAVLKGYKEVLHGNHEPFRTLNTREERRCIFLGDDNLCKVYEVRPIMCRAQAVFSDPKLCTDTSSNNVLVYSPAFKLIVALLAKEDNVAPMFMPHALLKLMEGDKS